MITRSAKESAQGDDDSSADKGEANDRQPFADGAGIRDGDLWSLLGGLVLTGRDGHDAGNYGKRQQGLGKPTRDKAVAG